MEQGRYLLTTDFPARSVGKLLTFPIAGQVTVEPGHGRFIAIDCGAFSERLLHGAEATSSDDLRASSITR